MKKLYQLWKVLQCDKPAPTGPWRLSYLEVDEVKGIWAYPLVAVISVMPDRYYRDDFVTMDLPKLEETCKYFNEIADDNEHYEIREIHHEE